jgi:hypothetical protein
MDDIDSLMSSVFSIVGAGVLATAGIFIFVPGPKEQNQRKEMAKLDSTYQIWKTQTLEKSKRKDEQLRAGITNKNSEGITNFNYKSLDDNCSIAKEQTIIESARILSVNPASIYIILPDKDRGERFQNIYDYQQITFKSIATPTQNGIVSLATQQTLPITEGLTYKIYYHQLNEKNSLSEAAFYNYASTHANVKPEILKEIQNASLLYNRKMLGIEGIVDSVQLLQ